MKQTQTIEIKGVEFLVEFNYYPEEPMVMYYPDGSGYPGSPAEIEIISITHKETDFFEFFEDKLNEIEELLNEITYEP